MTLEKTLKLAGSFLKIARVFVIAIGIIVLFSRQQWHLHVMKS